MNTLTLTKRYKLANYRNWEKCVVQVSRLKIRNKSETSHPKIRLPNSVGQQTGWVLAEWFFWWFCLRSLLHPLVQEAGGSLTFLISVAGCGWVSAGALRLRGLCVHNVASSFLGRTLSSFIGQWNIGNWGLLGLVSLHSIQPAKASYKASPHDNEVLNFSKVQCIPPSLS